MGATLVAKALKTWAPHITDRAFRVLVRMSVTALDSDTEERSANLYFGGPELLAQTMASSATLESRQRQVRRGLEELIGLGAVELVNRAGNGRRQVYRLMLDRQPRVGGWAPKEVPRPKHWRTEKESTDADSSNPFDKGSPKGLLGELPDTASPAQADTASPAQADTASPGCRTRQVRPRNQEEPQQELSKEYVADLVDVAHSTATPEEPSENLEDLVSPSTTDNSNPTNTVVKEAGPPTSEQPAEPRCPQKGCVRGYILDTSAAHGIRRCPTCHPEPAPEEVTA